ncbi:MAG TPA: hypothetical protein PL066_03835, partial [bacterium]|nr:hypothetical protein [bacterium]
WGNDPSIPSDLASCTQKAFLSYNTNQINKFKDNFEYYTKIGNDYYFIIYYDSNDPDGYRHFSEYCKQSSPGCSCDVKISMMLLSCGVGDFVVNSARPFANGMCSTAGAFFDYPYILLDVLPNYVEDISGVAY